MPSALESYRPFKTQLLVCCWILVKKEHLTHGIPSDYAATITHHGMGSVRNLKSYGCLIPGAIQNNVSGTSRIKQKQNQRVHISCTRRHPRLSCYLVLLHHTSPLAHLWHIGGWGVAVFLYDQLKEYRKIQAWFLDELAK